MSEQRVTYTFGPLEHRGLIGSVALGQIAVLGAGIVLAIVAIDLSPSSGGLMAAIVACAAAALLAWTPVVGRTPHEWGPIVFAFALRRGRGRGRFRSPAPTQGRIAGGCAGADRGAEPCDCDLPRELAGVRIIAADDSARPLGIICERGGRRLTAVLACRVSAFALLDAEAQERRLARWGVVLSGACGSSIHRLQWIERTAPAQGDQLARWVHTERDPAVPLRGSAMVESYLELISSGTQVSQDHEVLLAVQVDARSARSQPTARGRDGLRHAVREATERVAQGLDAAEITVLGALSPGQIARTLRTAFDPYARGELTTLAARPDEDARGRGEDGAGDAIAATDAWPLAARETWDHYGADGALHATFWISGWPRVEVSPTFMDALLGQSGAVRTVAVCLEPVALDRSTREIEAAVTRDRADRELRARFGQTETARQRQAAQATVRRESELAAGHGEVRLSGFVTVSGRDEDDLRRSCAEVLEHAARARLELRRLYGQQAEAFTFTLPLCRGLR